MFAQDSRVLNPPLPPCSPVFVFEIVNPGKFQLIIIDKKITQKKLSKLGMKLLKQLSPSGKLFGVQIGEKT